MLVVENDERQGGCADKRRAKKKESYSWVAEWMSQEQYTSAHQYTYQLPRSVIESEDLAQNISASDTFIVKLINEELNGTTAFR